jgi:riboflavin kinase / FMN adenylyltransferase
MKISRNLTGPALSQGSVVAIGAFDGLHLGHQALLHTLVERARTRQLRSALVSFEPLPREFFRQADFLRILSVRQKLRLLQATSLDHLLLLRFNQALAEMQPEQFVETVLVARLHAREVFVGADFRFGAKRAGTLATLQSCGARFGFQVHTLTDVCVEGARVSASQIRRAVAQGDFQFARAALGRPYSFAGRVQHGQKLGRTLGYPTANLAWPADNPLRGIFSVRVSSKTLHQHPAVASLGTRPVVNGVEPLLEVYLLDFAGDLYGQELSVEFIAKQREEQNFPDLPALVRQIEHDVQQARANLASIA